MLTIKTCTKQKLFFFFSNLHSVWMFRVDVGELGCSHDGHVLGDQQTEQDTPYFTQLWTQLFFWFCWESLGCVAMHQFPFFAFSGSAILYPELDDII